MNKELVLITARSWPKVVELFERFCGMLGGKQDGYLTTRFVDIGDARWWEVVWIYPIGTSPRFLLLCMLHRYEDLAEGYGLSRVRHITVCQVCGAIYSGYAFYGSALPCGHPATRPMHVEDDMPTIIRALTSGTTASKACGEKEDKA